MIGEFLLEVTLFQATVVVLVYVVFLGILAYKKPLWYRDALRIFAIVIGLIFIYSLGWEQSIAHHNIPYVKQSNIHSDFIGFYVFIMLIDNLWFAPVVENRLEEVEVQIENEKA